MSVLKVKGRPRARSTCQGHRLQLPWPQPRLHWERAQVLEHLWAKDAVQLRMLFATASTFFVEPRLGPGQLQPMALAGTSCTWATFHFQHRHRGRLGPDILTACALDMLTQSFWVNRVRQRDAISCRNLT